MQESPPGNMLSFFKKLFSKSPARAVSETPAPAAPPPANPATAPAVATPAADAIPVSLKAIVATMPDTLKAKLEKKLNGSELIYVAREEVMRQLPTGSVKIPLNQIVRMAPNTFAPLPPETLTSLVSVPLQEILPKIKSLPRREPRKVVEVPQDLAPIFGAGEGTAKPIEIPAAPAPPSAPSPIPAAAPVPTPIPVAPAPSAPKEEAYVPPPPKPLPPQAPIALKPPAPAPVPPPEPTPAPTSTDQPTLGFGDIFGQPEKTDWTPQEIVDKAAGLRGIAGALITTVDGLPVAFHLPDNLSGNLVAAFVPQMFTRIIQYTRDLKLGEAKHLTILIESVPLQIFKSGNFYFTVLGRANENLPKPQLTAISAALARQGQ